MYLLAKCAEIQETPGKFSLNVWKPKESSGTELTLKRNFELFSVKSKSLVFSHSFSYCPDKTFCSGKNWCQVSFHWKLNRWDAINLASPRLANLLFLRPSLCIWTLKVLFLWFMKWREMTKPAKSLVSNREVKTKACCLTNWSFSCFPSPAYS